MGQANARRRRLLKENPVCCFCGGTRPAVTEDHIPGRSVFHNREWPEGYSFPACQQCNAYSRAAENAFKLISRIHPDPKTQAEADELAEACKGVINNFPGLVESMLMSANKVKSSLRRMGISIPPGKSTNDFPMIDLSDPRIEDVIDVISVKTGLALHYKHTGNILPRTGRIFTTFFTNSDVDIGVVPEKIFDLPLIKDQKRQNIQLSSQFHYGFWTSESGNFSAFACYFRHSVMTFIALSADGSRLERLKPQRILSPLGPWD